MDEPHPIRRKIKQKAEEGRTALLCLTAELAHWHSPALGWGITPSAAWFSGLASQTELQHWLRWVSSWQMAESGTSQPPRPCEPISQSKSTNREYGYISY